MGLVLLARFLSKNAVLDRRKDWQASVGQLTIPIANPVHLVQYCTAYHTHQQSSATLFGRGEMCSKSFGPRWVWVYGVLKVVKGGGKEAWEGSGKARSWWSVRDKVPQGVCDFPCTGGARDKSGSGLIEEHTGWCKVVSSC